MMVARRFTSRSIAVLYQPVPLLDGLQFPIAVLMKAVYKYIYIINKKEANMIVAVVIQVGKVSGLDEARSEVGKMLLDVVCNMEICSYQNPHFCCIFILLGFVLTYFILFFH